MGKNENTLNGFPVEKRRLDELVKAPWNPRKISEEQRVALQRSLKEFGNVEPVVWNKQTGHIVGGHQRVDALIDCGETETDIVVVDMPEEREQALNIALNKISGEWDSGLLSDVLLSMHEDLRELTGFSDKELEAILNSDSQGPTPIVVGSSLFEVCVSCDSEEEQETLFNEMTSRGYSCRLLTL